MAASNRSETGLAEAGYPLGKSFAAASRCVAERRVAKLSSLHQQSLTLFARLNLQHYLFKDLLRYSLHPDIPVRGNDSDFRVADIGTGTGIWLTDIQQRLPSAQLDGFDNCLDQCPPKEFLPPNVSLQALDVCEEIPEELLGKYDVVHVRHFLLVVTNDPTSLLKNLVALLKPGGYLQWVEYDPLSVYIDSIDPGLQQTATEKFLGTIKGRRNYDWVAKLPQYLNLAGLKTTKSVAYRVPPGLRMSFTYVQLLAAEELSLVALDNSGPWASGPMYRRELKAVFEESKRGVSMVWNPRVFVAQKQS